LSVHLASLRYVADLAGDRTERYPFSTRMVRTLDELSFSSPVTFLVGENGSGKSTLLESLAVAAGAVTVGSESVQTDKTLGPARDLARCLKLSWKKKTHKGFFLRSEDFFQFCKRLTELRADMQQSLEEAERTFANRSITAQQYARSAYVGSIRAMESRYGEDLDANSHGESFLKLFQARFVPDGLYILDEPETPLSPMRQLSLLSMILEMVRQGCQFIIATHSPILMACPGATILSLDHAPIQAVRYDELEHVQVTRSFLNNPEAFLRHL
jgi:predicted ATPase